MSDITTRLITNPRDRAALTTNGEVDCRTALTRALSEYLSTLTRSSNGREFQFKGVYEQSADTEDLERRPSALVTSAGDGDFDMNTLTPMIEDDTGPDETQPDTAAVQTSAEFTVVLAVLVFCHDLVERTAICKMIEDGMEPVDWMYGARLEMPYYYGQRAEFSLESIAYEDVEADRARRFRNAVCKVRASVVKTKATTLRRGTTQNVIEVSQDLDLG